MHYSLGIISFLLAYTFVRAKIYPVIAGGAQARYSEYSHSVFLHIKCSLRYTYRCGGSVLNQDLVLTAGHCLIYCQKLKNETVLVRYGHEEINKMQATKMKDFITHPKYKQRPMLNDICLVLTEERIRLNDVIKRVILVMKPAKYEYGYVAGWGLDENKKVQPILKHTKQLIQEKDVCREWGLGAAGTFCAGPIQGTGTADQGDSGSAFVVENYIQIGLVSYRKPSKRSLVAYTNVSYFLNWIQKAARTIVCKHKNKTIN